MNVKHIREKFNTLQQWSHHIISSACVTNLERRNDANDIIMVCVIYMNIEKDLFQMDQFDTKQVGWLKVLEWK